MSERIKILSLEIPDRELFSYYGALSYDDAIEIVERHLKLDYRKTTGFQKYGAAPRRIDIGIKEQYFWEMSVQNKIDETVKLDSGKVINICVPNQQITEVFVKYVPMDWEKDRVKRIFGYYGMIKSAERMAIRVNEISTSEYAGQTNGVIKIRMKLKKDIPSNMVIDSTRIEIYYRNQVRTCWTCGYGHIQRDCKTLRDKYINRFSIEDFPILEQPRRAEENEDEDEPDMNNPNARSSRHSGAGYSAGPLPSQQRSPDIIDESENEIPQMEIDETTTVTENLENEKENTQPRREQSVLQEENIQSLNKENTQPLIDETSQLRKEENTQLGKEENTQLVNEENTQLVNEENTQLGKEENTQMRKEEDTQLRRGKDTPSNSYINRFSIGNTQLRRTENTQVMKKENPQMRKEDITKKTIKVDVHHTNNSQNTDILPPQISMGSSDETLTASETEQLVDIESAIAQSPLEFSSQPTPAQRTKEKENENGEDLLLFMDTEETVGIFEIADVEKRKRNDVSSTEDETNDVTHFELPKQPKRDKIG